MNMRDEDYERREGHMKASIGYISMAIMRG